MRAISSVPLLSLGLSLLRSTDVDTILRDLDPVLVVLACPLDKDLGWG